MVLYVLSRSLLSLLPRLYNTASPPKTPIEPLAHPLPSLTSPQANPKPIPPAQLPFAVLAALSWASVMYMFRHRGERIQPGMANSMSTFFFFNFYFKVLTGWCVRGQGLTLSFRIFVSRFGNVARPEDFALA